MSISKTLASVALLGIGAVGAFVIYDRIPEVDPIPTNGPMAALQLKEGRSIPFGAAVPNPAGITWMADSATYLISTDDRVVAEVSADFGTVLSQITLPATLGFRVPIIPTVRSASRFALPL